MSEREIDPVDAELAELDARPPRRPRFVLTRHQVAIIIVAGYAAIAVGIKLFLSYLASTQGVNDERDEQAAMLFALVMVVLCIKALINIYRPVKPF